MVHSFNWRQEGDIEVQAFISVASTGVEPVTHGFSDQQAAKEGSAEEIIKSCRVRVKYNAVSESKAKAKHEIILIVIIDSARRMNREKG